MILYTDSREQAPLDFPKVEGVTYERIGLEVGDYTAAHEGVRENVRIERKGCGDLFTSFTSNYDAERAKILKAKELGLTYILAIEGTLSDILKGHSYYAKGEWHVSRKTGIAMVRQLCSIEKRHNAQVWYCSSRYEMAFRIQEYFLATTRMKPDAEV